MSSVTAHRYHAEVIDGIEREKPLPKRLHIIIQMRIKVMLDEQYGMSRELVLPELDVRLGDGDYVVPDIVVTRPDSIYRNDMLGGPEESCLCVEIMSPGQTLSDMIDKCERLIAGGCPMCWLIWPSKRLAYMLTDGKGLLSETRQLWGGVALDHVKVPVPDLFKDLPEDAQ